MEVVSVMMTSPLGTLARSPLLGVNILSLTVRSVDTMLKRRERATALGRMPSDSITSWDDWYLETRHKERERDREREIYIYIIYYMVVIFVQAMML